MTPTSPTNPTCPNIARMILPGLLFSLVLLVARPGVRAQEPSLEVVLARAAAYVDALHRQLTGIVAEESYSQEARTTGRTSSGAAITKRVRLTSDFLLVRPRESDRYVEFRDVFEVNGRAVRDREERLTRLFLDPAANADQVRAIIEESARQNVGNIPRNVNTPMLALFILQSEQQPRFRFRRASRRTPDLTGPEASGPKATFHVSTEMWIVEFKETRDRTFIRTYEGRDFPAAGRFWIDPESGAVLMSELVMDGAEVNAVIDVSYQSEPLLGFRVPIEMRERYSAPNERVDGVATYGKFRQFAVRTEEEIALPAAPGPTLPSKPSGNASPGRGDLRPRG